MIVHTQILCVKTVKGVTYILSYIPGENNYNICYKDYK